MSSKTNAIVPLEKTDDDRVDTLSCNPQPNPKNKEGKGERGKKKTRRQREREIYRTCRDETEMAEKPSMARDPYPFSYQ